MAVTGSCPPTCVWVFVKISAIASIVNLSSQWNINCYSLIADMGILLGNGRGAFVATCILSCSPSFIKCLQFYIWILLGSWWDLFSFTFFVVLEGPLYFWLMMFISLFFRWGLHACFSPFSLQLVICSCINSLTLCLAIMLHGGQYPCSAFQSCFFICSFNVLIIMLNALITHRPPCCATQSCIQCRVLNV